MPYVVLLCNIKVYLLITGYIIMIIKLFSPIDLVSMVQIHEKYPFDLYN